MLAGGPGTAAARRFDIDWAGNAGVEPGRLCGRCSAKTSRRRSRRATSVSRRRRRQLGMPVFRRGASRSSGPVGPGRKLAGVLQRQHYKLAEWRSGTRPQLPSFLRRRDTRRRARRGRSGVPRRRTRSCSSSSDRAGSNGLRVDHIDGLADPRRIPRSGSAAATDRRVHGRREDPRRRRGCCPTAGRSPARPGYDALDELCGRVHRPRRPCRARGGVLGRERQRPVPRGATRRQVAGARGNCSSRSGARSAMRWPKRPSAADIAVTDVDRRGCARGGDRRVAGVPHLRTGWSRARRGPPPDRRGARRRAHRTGLDAAALTAVGRVLLGDDLPAPAAIAPRSRCCDSGSSSPGR